MAHMEIELQRCEQISVDTVNFVDYSQIAIKRVNKTKVRGVFGSFTYHTPLDNTYKIQIEFYLKQGGEYPKLPFKLAEKRVCDFYREEEYTYAEFSQSSNLPMPLPCPIPTVSNLYTLEF